MSRRTIISMLLVAATAGAYGRVISFGFVALDDKTYVTEVPQVVRGMTADGLVWALRNVPHGAWQPLTFLSHMLDCNLYGLNGGGHHLTGLILHLFCTLGVFAIWDRMTGRCWPSAVVAALFALHPLHVESVAWISSRKDVLSMALGLLSIWAYVGFARRGGAGRYLATTLLLALGLAAKPILVTLPFVLLLLEYWPLQRVRIRARAVHVEADQTTIRGRQRSPLHLVIEKVPLFILVAAFSAITFVLERGEGTVHTLDKIPLATRAANIAVSYVLYLQKTAWPAGLTINYPHPNLLGGTPWETWHVVGAGALLLAITVVVLSFQRRYAVVGWFWFLGTMVPVIGFVFDGSVAMADRYTYVPLIGLFVMVAWLMDEAAIREGRWRKGILPAANIAVAIILAACIITTRRQTGHWRDTWALYEHAANTPPVSPITHWNWAHELHFKGRLSEAIESYRRAVDLSPRLFRVHYSLALALGESGLLTESIESFRRTLELMPSFADGHEGLAGALVEAGQPQKAIEHFRRAVQLNPDLVEAHYRLARLLRAEHSFDEAIQHYHHALRIRPTFARASLELGQLYHRQGRHDDATEHYGRALDTQPDLVDALHRMAWILATHADAAKRNPAKAVSIAERASELTDRHDAKVLDALAVAYAASGRFQDAIRTAQAAKQLASAPGYRYLLPKIQRRLQRFRAGQAYLDPSWPPR